jgi:hypothetical protein
LNNQTKEGREAAEAKFAKAQKSKQEGAKAMAQYEADARAVREKTSRLRALRLAKEAADLVEAEANKPVRKKS